MPDDIDDWDPPRRRERDDDFDDRDEERPRRRIRDDDFDDRDQPRRRRRNEDDEDDDYDFNSDDLGRRRRRGRFDENDDDFDRDPRFPAMASLAGYAWIGISAFILLGVFVNIVEFAQGQQIGKGNANRRQDLETMCGVGFIALCAVALLIAGVMTVSGAVQGTMAIGITSIVFSLLFLLGGIISAGQNDEDAVVGCFVIFFGLLAPGVISCVVHGAYRDWKRFKTRRSRRRDFD